MMNCSEFASNWQALVTETLDEEKKSEMSEHALVCQRCGEQLREHEDLRKTIDSVLGPLSLPADIASCIANEVHQQRFGASLNMPQPSTTTSDAPSYRSMPVFIALILGFAIGLMLSRQGGQSNLTQQMLQAEMFGPRYGRYRRGDFAETMLYAQLLESDGFGAGGSMVGGKLLPAVNSIVRMLFLVCLLTWVARTRAWEGLYRGKIPKGIEIGRWFVLLPAMLGLARCAATLYLTLAIVPNMAVGGQGDSESSWLSSTIFMLDQLWSIGFWLTLMILFFTVANQFVINQVEQGQPRPRT